MGYGGFYEKRTALALDGSGLSRRADIRAYGFYRTYTPLLINAKSVRVNEPGKFAPGHIKT